LYRSARAVVAADNVTFIAKKEDIETAAKEVNAKNSSQNPTKNYWIRMAGLWRSKDRHRKKRHESETNGQRFFC
jgi:hypothetical protein